MMFFTSGIHKKVISHKTNQIFTSTCMESIEIMHDKFVHTVEEYCEELVQQNVVATVMKYMLRKLS